MSDIYKSCRYIESGLSLSYRFVRACAVVQNGRGRPILFPVAEGDEIDIERVLAAKEKIRAENRAGGNADCAGCPHLQTRDWSGAGDRLTWIGITNYVLCNVLCTYCWLNTEDHSPMKPHRKIPPQKYRIGPMIDQLIDKGLLASDAIIDWGGGGEPTLNPDFDHCFSRLYRLGATQWLHTNAVRVPETLSRHEFGPDKLNVLCSLDAGTRFTYARIKQRDRFDRVIANLRRYGDIGAVVVPKFLAVADNSTIAEAEAFVAISRDLGARTVIIDVDHRYPKPAPSIVETLRHIKSQATEAGIQCRFEAVGSNSAEPWLVQELNA